MKRRLFIGTLFAGWLLGLAALSAQAREGWFHRIVEADFVAKYAVIPKPEGVLVVDSRPAARKYDPGHIPTAVNVPDSQFEKLQHLLPADKSALVIFYCDGPECMLSHNSAFKAEKLGYTNVHVYAAGYPDWAKSGRAVAVTAPPAIQPGKEDGSISVASFERIYKESPQSITLVDVRDPAEFAAGSFRGASNIPINALEKRIDELNAGKPIVYFCGTAGRAGEAHDMTKLLRPDLKSFFVNATIKWTKDGSYTMAEIR